MRLAFTVAALVIAGGAVLVGIVASTSISSGAARDIYLLFICAIAVLALLKAIRGFSMERFSYEQNEPSRQSDGALPPGLSRIERGVALGAATSFDFHFRLRPLLQEIARQRLTTHHGIDLELRHLDAQVVLGKELWEIVRPDKEPPANRFAAGLSLDRLRTAVTRLEQI
jgi:hypothetical protein